MSFEMQEVVPEHRHIPCAKYKDLFEYHLAISNEGPHAYNWQDKPHRLVYDLTRIATEHREEITRLRAELTECQEKLYATQHDLAEEKRKVASLVVHVAAYERDAGASL